ncbi:MAG: nedA 2 [Akkermansiaceae bacterium]|nr:nedA 2 [Akkermansiaceae bacterium]
MKRTVFDWTWKGLLLAAVIAASATAEEPAPPSGEYIFKSRTEGYNTFRIPAIVATPKGTLLAFTEGRKNGPSDGGDIDIVMKRSTDKGKTWSPLEVVWNDGENACSNPCPVVVSKTGRVVLLGVRKPGRIGENDIMKGRVSPDERCRPFTLKSDDDGKTWQAPQEITASADRDNWLWYVTGPGNGIELHHGPHAGRLLIPCNHSTYEYGQATYNAHTIYSDDHGETWQISRTEIAPGANESTVAELSDGSVIFNCRMQKHGIGQRGEAVSHDGGETWTGFRNDGPLKCPTCEASLISVEFVPKDSKERRSALMFSNPQGRGRTNLTIQMSMNNGKSWEWKLPIEPGLSYGYSSLTHIPGGGFGILFEGPQDPSGGILWRTFDIHDFVINK